MEGDRYTPTIMLDENTFEEIEKVRSELCQLLKVKSVSKDRVVVELLSVYREKHPEPATLESPKTEKPKKTTKRLATNDSSNSKRAKKTYPDFPTEITPPKNSERRGRVVLEA